MEITAREIANYILGKKRLAELEFKINYLEQQEKHEQKQQSINEKIELEKKIKGIEDKMEKMDFEIIYPCKIIINDYDKIIKQKNMSEIEKALKQKTGELYEALLKRAAIVKHNIKNASSIAQLSIKINKLKNRETYDRLKRAIEYDAKFGELGIWLDEIDEKRKIGLLYKLNRLGYDAYFNKENMLFGNGDKIPEGIRLLKEERIVLQNGKILWIPRKKAIIFKENKKKLDKLGLEMQIQMAKKSLYKFTDEQEKEFEKLQTEYLKLLAKHNEFVVRYEENEDVKFKRNF